MDPAQYPVDPYNPAPSPASLDPPPSYPYQTPTVATQSSITQGPAVSPFANPISGTITNFSRTLLTVDDRPCAAGEDMNTFKDHSSWALGPYFYNKHVNGALDKTIAFGLDWALPAPEEVTAFGDMSELFQPQDKPYASYTPTPTAPAMRSRLDKEKAISGDTLSILFTHRAPAEGFDKFRESTEKTQNDYDNSHIKIFLAKNDPALFDEYSRSVAGIPRVEVLSKPEDPPHDFSATQGSDHANANSFFNAGSPSNGSVPLWTPDANSLLIPGSPAPSLQCPSLTPSQIQHQGPYLHTGNQGWQGGDIQGSAGGSGYNSSYSSQNPPITAYSNYNQPAAMPQGSDWGNSGAYWAAQPHTYYYPNSWHQGGHTQGSTAPTYQGGPPHGSAPPSYPPASDTAPENVTSDYATSKVGGRLNKIKRMFG